MAMRKSRLLLRCKFYFYESCALANRLQTDCCGDRKERKEDELNHNRASRVENKVA